MGERDLESKAVLILGPNAPLLVRRESPTFSPPQIWQCMQPNMGDEVMPP